MGTEGETKANNNAIAKKYDDDGGWAEFVWNNKTKQFFGRTGASWGKSRLFSEGIKNKMYHNIISYDFFKNIF